MSINSYNGLLAHRGHKIVVASYGPYKNPENVAIECETCNEVLLDFNKPSEKKKKLEAECVWQISCLNNTTKETFELFSSASSEIKARRGIEATKLPGENWSITNVIKAKRR